MISRRTFLTTATAAIVTAPFVAEAQRPGQRFRIGFIGVGDGVPVRFQDAFNVALREAGFTIGDSVAIEYRWLGSRLQPSPEVARELVHRGVDVIVGFGTPATLSATQVTKVIPIVMLGVRDPVEQGIVASLARPGANVTGIASSVTAPGVAHSKGMSLFKEAVPAASRVAHLTNSTFPGTQANVDALVRLAPTLHMEVYSFDIRTAEEVEPVFARITRQRMDAVSIDAALWAYRARIIPELARVRLPSYAGISSFAEEGALMAFGPDWPDLFKHAGRYVGRILGGAKPADLPVEQPTKLALVLNLKTAKALGLTIPPSVLLRADQVIE